MPILVWLAVTIVMLVIGYAMLSGVGLTYDKQVLRRGEATIESCSPNLMSLGTTQTCRATIEWQPEDEWRAGGVTLDAGPSYTVESTRELSGTVMVEGHRRSSRNVRHHEAIVPADQSPSAPNPAWFVVGLGVPIVISAGLMWLVILPWIRRRTRAAEVSAPTSDDPTSA